MTLLRINPADEGVVVLTLDRPDKRNALSVALRDEVTAALGALATDEAVKVVVLTGAGAVFSAGFDLKEFGDPDPEFQRRLWASSDAFHRAVLTFPLPIVAAVNGPALAGGFDLAVMCDVRVAADTAVFAHPEQQWSQVVYGPLHDLVGGAVARDLALTGRQITAEQALAWGLVCSVVPASEVVDEARRVAGSIAGAPRPVLLQMKAKIIRRAGITVGPTLDL
ncbi:MAG TPA: enoyl-CoA hydratase/isomerase family protein [Acidimicrobiales bacterium]